MFDDSPSTQTPTQIIFYGVPGSGKSHSIKNELVKKGITDLKEQTKRVVFHPEYTNADFVGQILPQSSDGGKTISYPFVPGPFTQILAKAYTHQNTHYALIIEEINRGNAAAIFGELFQLLDRLDEDETESSNEVAYTKGWSSYSINNDNINKAIQEAYENFKSDSNFEPFINKEIACSRCHDILVENIWHGQECNYRTNCQHTCYSEQCPTKHLQMIPKSQLRHTFQQFFRLTPYVFFLFHFCTILTNKRNALTRLSKDISINILLT